MPDMIKNSQILKEAGFRPIINPAGPVCSWQISERVFTAHICDPDASDDDVSEFKDYDGIDQAERFWVCIRDYHGDYVDPDGKSFTDVKEAVDWALMELVRLNYGAK